VRRSLRLLCALQLPDCVGELAQQAQRTSQPERQQQQQQQPNAHGPPPKRPRGGGADDPSGSARRAVLLPREAACALVLHRLLAACALLRDAQPAILKAARDLIGQLSMGYFMPFCLAAAAVIARLRVLCAGALANVASA
ncbi:hypothetical protein MNEG_16175, partial [Monoraphidium neglectum]